MMTDRMKRLRGAARVTTLLAVVLLSGAAVVSMVGTHLTVRADEVGTNSVQRVPAKVMAARIESQVQPKYPEQAKKKRIQGTVVLNVEIGKDGTVDDVKVASGPKELRQSALVAVRQWTYKPYLLDGSPVEVDTTISVVYTLNE